MKLEVEKGNVVLVHSHTFLPKGIQIMMNVSRWLRLDFKPFYKEISNHAAIGIGNNMILEAVKKGTKSGDFFGLYGNRTNVTIKVYEYNWSEDQLNVLDKLTPKYSDIPYEFSNFLVWILNIITFGIVWIGRRGTNASKQIYCSELISTMLYYMTVPFLSKNNAEVKMHNYLRKFWQKSPYQIEMMCEEYMKLKNTYIL